MRALAFFLFLGLGFVASADEAATLAKGRELTATYLKGDTASVFAQMEPRMQGFVGGADAFAKFSASSVAELGKETEVLSETVRQDAGFAIYERTSRCSKVKDPCVIRWEILADGKIAGFGIHTKLDQPEPAPTRHLDYGTKTSLRLPFEGEWTVFNGGRTVEQNHHVVQAQQRFAYDIAIAREGRSYRGAGKTLEDYYCWGAPVVAPSAGTVVAAVDGLRDQPIGSREPGAGNHLILDLGNGEYAVLGHFRQGSLRVKSGDSVNAGQELGRCGNSGNTTEPHLHFHLQNSPRLGEGEGLPALFVDYVADGKHVARGEPVKGQVVRAQ